MRFINKGKNEQTSFYDFNDTMITKVNDDYVKNFQGGSEESGYLLIYRKKNEELPKLNVDSIVTDHIIQKIKTENLGFAEQRIIYETLKSKIRIKVVTLSLLVETEIISKENLKKVNMSLPEDFYSSLIFDKGNLKGALVELETLLGNPLANYRAFEISVKYNDLIYYKNEIDWNQLIITNPEEIKLKYGSTILFVEKDSGEEVDKFLNNIQAESVS